MDLNDGMKSGLEQAARIVLDSRHLVALAGAGLSVESGIPTFRGAAGLWSRYGQPSMLSYREFVQDPGLWWERRLREESDPGTAVYELKSAVEGAAPNPGHYSLAQLERWGILKSLITQNVDDLHHQAGSKTVLEIHGNRNWLRCIDCSRRRPRAGFEFADLPPQCPECNGIIKLDTVMFGEPVPAKILQVCWEQARRCDCMLLIGTSGVVNPAAQLPLVAREQGAWLIEFNPDETAITPHCHLALNGPAGELLPLLMQRLKQLGAGCGIHGSPE